jgi:hypothetical protein
MSLGSGLTGTGSVKTAGEAGGTGVGFTSDITVSLPNNGAPPAQVPALQLTTSLTNATPGAEASKWVIKLLNAGAQVTALDIRPTQLLQPTGTNAAPGSSYQAFPSAGIVPGVGIGTLGALNLCANGTPILQVDYQNGLITIGSGYSYFLNTDLLRGMKQGGNGVAAGDHNVVLFSDKDVQIGADGALAIGTTVGFLDLPSCAGNPNAAPTDVRSGKIAAIVDSTNFRLFLRFGATWKSALFA